MQNETSQPVAILTPEQLRALIREDREETLAEWQRRQAPRKLSSEQAAVRCGRVRPDGTANQAAFKTFLARNPDLPREKAGRRLVFDEGAPDRWLAAHTSRAADPRCDDRRGCEVATHAAA